MKCNTTNHKSKFIVARAIVLSVIVGAMPFMNILRADAAPITGRSIALSSSAGDATGVTYTLITSALPTNTAIKSLEVKVYDSLAGPTTPAGFSSSASTLGSQPSGLGSTSGWAADTTAPGSLRIVNGTNSTNSNGAVTVAWNGVHNPSAANTTFYGVVSTYSNADFTGLIDNGSVAMSTSMQIQVALDVGETLTFCAGTSITGQDCGTATGGTVNLGSGSTSITAKGTSILAASTNGSSGYTISVNGSTLASGVNTITALSSGDTSKTNTKQFGINLADSNTIPSVGSARSGAGTATATTNYSINNTFRFAAGDQIVSVAGASNANTFTVGYIANIDGLTPAGAYTTNLNYVATANF